MNNSIDWLKRGLLILWLDLRKKYLIKRFFFRNYPNYYYAMNVTTPDGATIDIFMIDTVMMCGNSDDADTNYKPEGPDSVLEAEDQWAWLEQQMAASK